METRKSNAIMAGIFWPDAQVERIAIDYDDLVIELNEPIHDSTVVVRCAGYIGYCLLGFWDDTIVESAKLLDGSDFQLSCLQSLERYGPELHDSGNEARNRRSYQTLSIRFIDGAVLNIVAAEFALS